MSADEPSPTDRELRDAALAAVLAEAVRGGRLLPTDALRVIKHEMRSRNTNRKERLPHRSVAAQQVIEDCAALGVPVPKNDSLDALHADHVYEFGPTQLAAAVTVDQWLVALKRARTVVVVTARENYELEQLERAGVVGPQKYVQAGIEWAGEAPRFMPDDLDGANALDLE